jgi:hypothetical protein
MQKVPFDRCEESPMVKSVTLLREKVQWYFRNINYENIHAKNIDNKEIVNLWVEGFMIYL